MSDTTHTIGSTGIVKKLVDLGDSTYADAVVDVSSATAGTEQVLAAGTGSTGGLGKIATVDNAAVIYVRCAASGAGVVDWRIQANQKHDLQFYKARSIVDSVTLTLSSFTDTNTVVINGLTYTGEATATDAAYASRKFSTAGGTDTLDAAALAAIINADYAVVTAGTSVAATDKLTITTDVGAHTITAAATADYPGSKYGLSSTQATELASIIAAINHRDNVTCASVEVGDTVTVGGITYTAAEAEDTAAHEFAQITSDDATGTSLAACVNADTATHGISAANASGVVSFTRDTAAAVVGLATSNATRLDTEAAGGVPGVIAAATGVAGELSITPVWTEVLTVTESGDRLTVTDIDLPGVKAVAADAVVTLTPGTAGGDAELATVIQATAAANCTVAQATLASLIVDGDAVADMAANNTTAGKIYSQDVHGYEYCYAGITNDSGGAAATVVVGATLRR